MHKTSEQPSVVGLSAREFFALAIDGKSMADAARDARVSYSALRRHVTYGKPISPENAERLERWSNNEISATRTLELKTEFRFRKKAS